MFTKRRGTRAAPDSDDDEEVRLLSSTLCRENYGVLFLQTDSQRVRRNHLVGTGDFDA